MTNKPITQEVPQWTASKERDNAVTLRRILAPTDLKSDGRKALEYAFAFARHFNARLTILHVFPDLALIDYTQSADTYDVADHHRQTAQRALDSFRSELRYEYGKVDTLLGCGKPEEEIVAAARELDVDLIVLSTHNYHWFSHLIRGSDAEGVLRHAPCPVLIVR